jgi:hypothetical protein
VASKVVAAPDAAMTGVEDGTGLAFSDGADDLGVVGGVPAGQVAGPGAPQPEPGGVEGRLVDAFGRCGPQVGGGGGGDLVQPVVPAHDEGGGAAPGEYGGQDRGEARLEQPIRPVAGRAGLVSGAR